jgi:hypothetical protein
MLRIENVVAEYMLARKTTDMFVYELSLACDEIAKKLDIITLADMYKWERFKHEYYDLFNIKEAADDRFDKIILTAGYAGLRREIISFVPLELLNLRKQIAKILTAKEFDALIETKRREHRQEEQKLKELRREGQRLGTFVKELPRTTH